MISLHEVFGITEERAEELKDEMGEVTARIYDSSERITKESIQRYIDIAQDRSEMYWMIAIGLEAVIYIMEKQTEERAMLAELAESGVLDALEEAGITVL